MAFFAVIDNGTLFYPVPPSVLQDADQLARLASQSLQATSKAPVRRLSNHER